MVDVNGEWWWELLRHRLPDSILLRLAAITRPMPSFPVDSIGWRLQSDGRFSIKTAYQGDFAKSGADWDLMFAAVLWNVWRYRNDRVFNNQVEEWGSIITRSKWLAENTVTAAVAYTSASDPYVIISYIRQICNKDWQIVFSKVARSNNKVADWLAKFASDTNFDVIFF
ncbi:hypothetical protein V6N13_036543 [Hibiscus sabdariffa]